MSEAFIEPDHFFETLRSGRKFLDVRSEGEYEAQAFEGVRNLPILNNQERHEVGLCYAERGSQEAITLGHRLVSGSTKEKRVQSWANFIRSENPSAIFCWRGGMRSQLAQTWLTEVGLSIPRIRGGYKALRNYFLSFLEGNISQIKMVIVAARTGSGKTTFLNSLSQTRLVIDLEQLAKHRGSAFGEGFDLQPTQATFENNLIQKLIRIANEYSTRPIFLEDESKAIGRVHIPQLFFDKMELAPRIILEVPLEKRVANIIREYVEGPLLHFTKNPCGKDPVSQLQEHLLERLRKIKDRLGGARFQECHQLLIEACSRLARDSDFSAHRIWIEKILEYYYDPYYEKYQAKHADKVILSIS